MVTRTQQTLRVTLGNGIRDIRLAVGWTQGELAGRAKLSRPMVARVEGADVNVSVDVVANLCDALGVRVGLQLDAPFLADRRRQREPAHARCIAYAQRRLEAEGWLTQREVEIAFGRSHGWIDILAFDPRTGTLLVVEIKTEIEDLGRIERTLAWYEREAWAAARRLGWRPRRVATLLLVLATEANDARLSANRDSLAQAFPVRAPDLPREPRSRGIALIDPRSRARSWLIRTRLDGRRSIAPYADYSAFMRALRA